MWTATILALINAGYGGQDACFDPVHVLSNVPIIAEKRQGLAERFFPRADRIEEKKMRLAGLQAGLDAVDASRAELEGSIRELDEEIHLEEATLRADLDEAIAKEKETVEAFLLEKGKELREILDIGELRAGCEADEIVTDVTDALLAHLRGDPIE